MLYRYIFASLNYNPFRYTLEIWLKKERNSTPNVFIGSKHSQKCIKKSTKKNPLSAIISFSLWKVYIKMLYEKY